MDEVRELLAASNARNEEKDLLVFEMEEKVSKLQSQVESHGESILGLLLNMQDLLLNTGVGRSLGHCFLIGSLSYRARQCIAYTAWPWIVEEIPKI